MTTRRPAPDWEILARYYAGESNPAEVRVVEAWLRDNADEAHALGLLDATIRSHSKNAVHGVDMEAALQRVKSGDVRLRPAGARSRWWIPAAAALAASLAGVLFWQSRAGTGTATTAAVYSTTVGQLDTLDLPDGSHVVLGPGSRLQVSNDFGRGARVVTLSGAGYFDVKHDARAPFEVRTAGAIIRDLGTVFSVRTIGGGVRVAVSSGKVAMHATRSSAATVTLSAGQVAETSPDGNPTDARAASPEEFSWTHGELAFRDAPLAVVASELKRWYGIELRVTDPRMMSRHLTATLSDVPLDDALRIISLALNARTERTGNIVTVTAADT